MRYKHYIKHLLPCCCALLLVATHSPVWAQLGGMPGGTRLNNQGRPMGPNSQVKGGDSLAQRNSNEDSITIYYRYFDSSRIVLPDSSLSDFTKRYPLPAHMVWLGSIGNAARSLIFAPQLSAGFDAGFHGYDVYRATVQGTRQYQTTRPYTELDYLLGPNTEQTIRVLHTQNIKPLWNATFDYRLINMPGYLKNSNAAHSNIKLYTTFSTKNRRYSGMALYLFNRNRSSENGGILNDTFLTSRNAAYRDERFNIPTTLGGDGNFTQSPFNNNYGTATDYRQRMFFVRHQYDLGQRDSIFDADSNLVKLFFPRLRLQHTFSYSTSSYAFSDALTSDAAYADVYRKRYGWVPVSQPLQLQDTWQDVTNEAALILFPQKTNQDQFLKLGAGLQLLRGRFGAAGENFSNTYLLGEYRNRTKNQKWDINANGRLYLAGFNGGDYQAAISMLTNLGSKLGTLRVGFQNVNRSPSFVFDTRSSFLVQGNNNFKKENWTILNAELFVNRLGLRLHGRYFLVSNYTYWSNFYEATQQATLQNVLQVGAEKVFNLSAKWHWNTEVVLQQATGTDINLPFLYTRNRLAYEGRFYKNLNLSTGLEVRYYSAHQADEWSPFNGQWVVQNRERIANRPEAAAFLHFRIRGLRLYIRAENLNTLSFNNGVGFTANNLSAPLFPTQGFVLRFGFHWTFVN
ncbi:MAG: hypothetical protein EAY75_11115 [Bacteroidetes bacterium]|nr:MAG: hypothetical protein EAY75_11115 [Bacteroidota bacterium]